MQLSFWPALGQTSHVSVPRWMRSRSIQLLFSVELDPLDWEVVKRAGGKVQLWSDAPSEGRSSGEWYELDFEEATDEQYSPETISLASVSSSSAAAESEKISLSLLVKAPFPGQTHSFFFTYRIVYASGEVRWLGAFGQNGSVVVEQSDSTLELGPGWTTQEDGVSLWSTQDGVAKDSSLGRLHNANEWTVYGIGENGFARDSTDSSVLFFVPPKSSGRTGALVDPFALIAGPEVTVSFTPDGNISATGSGSLRLQPCASNASVLREQLSAFAPKILRVIDVEDWYAILASPESAGLPVRLAVIPLSAREDSGQPIVPVKCLAGLLEEGKPESFSVFSPASLQARSFALSNLTGALHLAVPKTGGEFLLAPDHTITSTASEEQSCSISILSRHGEATTIAAPTILPTPPPSPQPQLRPRPSKTALTLAPPEEKPEESFYGELDEAPSNETQVVLRERTAFFAFFARLYAAFVALLASFASIIFPQTQRGLVASHSEKEIEDLPEGDTPQEEEKADEPTIHDMHEPTDSTTLEEATPAPVQVPRFTILSVNGVAGHEISWLVSGLGRSPESSQLLVECDGKQLKHETINTVKDEVLLCIAYLEPSGPQSSNRMTIRLAQ